MSEYTDEDFEVLKATAKKLTDLVKAAELVPDLKVQMCAIMHDEIVEADKAIQWRHPSIADLVAAISREPEPIPND